MLNRGACHLNSTNTEQVRGVVLRGIVLRVRGNGHAIVNDNGVAVPVSEVDGTLDAGGIGVLAELEQVLLRQVESNLGVHDGQAEDTGVVADGLLNGLSRSSLTEVVGLTSSTSAREGNVRAVELPRIPVVGMVIGDTEDTVHDADEAVLTLLIPVLRNLGSDLLHGVGAGVEVADEVLVTPSVHTTINDASLRTTGRIGHGHIGITVVVVVRTTKHVVERNGVQVGAIGNHASDLSILLNRAAVDHGRQGRVLGCAPVHVEDFFIKRVAKKHTRHLVHSPF